jgi:hypothetical protein
VSFGGGIGDDFLRQAEHGLDTKFGDVDTNSHGDMLKYSEAPIKIDGQEFHSLEELSERLMETGCCRNVREVRQWLAQNTPLESALQRKIMKWLKTNLPNAAVWKAQAGSYSQGGLPDICCVIDGRFYGFEVKRPFIGVISALQEQMCKRIQAAGGRMEFVSWPEDVRAVLEKDGYEFSQEK